MAATFPNLFTYFQPHTKKKIKKNLYSFREPKITQYMYTLTFYFLPVRVTKARDNKRKTQRIHWVRTA